MDPFLIRLLIGVLVYWIFSMVIAEFGGKSADILSKVLLVATVLYVVFGRYLPF